MRGWPLFPMGGTLCLTFNKESGDTELFGGNSGAGRGAIVDSEPKTLDRASVVDAIRDYVLQVNFRGYKPDYRKVLSVRQTDRTAWLRNATVPVRREVYYYIEGELFPEEGGTRLAPGQLPQDLAEKLVDSIWENLRVWNGYDFTATSSGMNRTLYTGEPPVATKDEPVVANKRDHD
jgi:hypothetical protein